MNWITTTPTEIFFVGISTIVIYIGLIFYTRLTGLRSFSKMSAFDFAMTVAVGSLFASTVSQPSPSILLGLFTLLFLFAGQWTIAKLREENTWVSSLTDNTPVLLMRDGEFMYENMKRTKVSKADLHAKLREANVLNYEQVRAVVFETTGDVSVLHSDDASASLSSELLEGVLK